jgi:hypothetical protein
MSLSLEDVLALLEQGKSLRQIHCESQPAGLQELLRRCAAVRWFDEPLVDAVLRPDAEATSREAVPFAQLVEQQVVERLPEPPGACRLRESVRLDLLRAWKEEEATAGEPRTGALPLPASLVALSRRLAEHFAQRGPEGSRECLYHLVVADPEAAEALFLDLYRQAEEIFDLPSCFDLLQLLDERRRQELLPQRLAVRLREYDRYYQARGLWAADHYRSARCFVRAWFEDEYRTLHDPGVPWILRIDAPGGMGKTMFLRWLIARRCAPLRIPCARVDFDADLPVEITREPWLLLLYMGRALNQQLPGTPFNDIIAELTEYQARLRPTPSPGETSGTSSGVDLPRQRLQQEFPDRFASALRSRPEPTPVILVVDTLEEAMLRPEADVEGLVHWLVELYQQCPDLRVILSGRYDLVERYPTLADLLGKVARSFHIPLFSPPESHGYLESRRIEAGGKRLAVVERAGGNPFKLALYADLLRAEPDVTEEQIRSFPAELIYLVKRILERIPDGRLQWLLRYGVIPRQLTFAFLEAVMVPCLPPGLAGGASSEERYHGIPEDLRSHKLFPVAPEQRAATPQERRALWEALHRYAAQSSWISAAPSGADAMVIHAEVRIPMRPLVRDEDAVRLHVAAIRHFEQQAQEQPETASCAIAEAVYHHFQAHGSATGSDYWHEQIRPPGTRPEWRRSLAVDLMGPDYLDEEGRPLPGPDGPMLTPALRVLAEFTAANATAELAQAAAGPADALWEEAERYLDRAEERQREMSAPAVPPARLTLLRATMLGRRQRGEDALALLEALDPDALEPEEQVRRLVELGDRLAERARREEALHAYNRAREQQSHLPGGAQLAADLTLRIARHQAAIGTWQDALGTFQAALARARDAGAPELEARLGLAETYLELGQPEQVQEHTSSAPAATASPLDLLRADAAQTRAHLALGEPDRALERCQSAFQRLAELESAGEATQPLLAAWRELRGEVYRELMEFDRARPDLEFASRAWRAAGQPQRAQSCALTLAVIELRGRGDFRRAASLIDQAERYEAQEGSESWLRPRLLRAEWLRGMDRSEDALKLVASLLEAAIDPQNPALRAAVAVEGLASLGREVAPRCLAMLHEALEALPPARRLPPLEPLRRSPVLMGLPDDLRDPILRLIDQGAMAVAESSRLRLLAADAFRVLDLRPYGELLLDRFERASDSHNLFLLRELLRARDRFGWDERDPQEYGGRVAAMGRFADYPLLQGVLLLEQAERLLAARKREPVERLLDQGEPFIQTSGPHTHWQARCKEDRALLALVRGQRARWETLLGEALSLYAELDNRVAVQRLREKLAQDERETVPGEGREATVHLELQPADGRLIGRLSLPTGDAPENAVDIAANPILAELLNTKTEEIFAYQLLKRIEDNWWDFALHLARLIGPRESWEAILRAAAEQPLALRLLLEHPSLSSLPWELLLFAPNLVDGLPRPENLWPAFYRDTPSVQRPRPVPSNLPETPQVLILRPGIEQERGSERGSRISGVDPASIYKNSGFDVWVVDEPSHERLQHELRERSLRMPFVLHVSASMKQSPQLGGAYLDFAAQGSYASAGYGEVFSTRDLADALSAVPPEAQPLIILDIFRPSHLTEALIQLFLRNTFAAELHQMIRLPALLAAGLTHPWEQEKSYYDLISSLRAGPAIGELTTRLRQIGYERAGPFTGDAAGLEVSLASIAIALFTSDPRRSLFARQ